MSECPTCGQRISIERWEIEAETIGMMVARNLMKDSLQTGRWPHLNAWWLRRAENEQNMIKDRGTT
jgi:hypothetical protein